MESGGVKGDMVRVTYLPPLSKRCTCYSWTILKCARNRHFCLSKGITRSKAAAVYTSPILPLSENDGD